MVVFVENPKKTTKVFLLDIISEYSKVEAGLLYTINEPLENDRPHGLYVCQNLWNSYANQFT